MPVQVSADELVVHALTKSLEAPHAGEVLLRLVTSSGSRMREVAVDPDDVGRPLGDVRGRHRGLVLGLVRADEVRIGVTDDPLVETGDHLVIVEPVPREAGS